MNSVEYNQKYYTKHRSKRVQDQLLRAAVRRKLVQQAKSKPCADCKIQYDYWIMQFDHVRGKKEFNIGNHVAKRGIDRLMLEIAKCDVVCSNCHADRTYKRQQRRSQLVDKAVTLSR